MKLPSDAAAQKLLAGKPGAVVDVAFWTSVRAALIAAGLWMVGDRHKLWLKGYAGALAVEVFVLLWAAAHREDA